jgi:phosphoglycolate phosphatase-like HAD superfamily hydrolase
VTNADARVRDAFAGVAAVAFDFDGVLVDSVDVKTRAFAALYADEDSALQAAVVRHHLAHGGISRHVKLAHYERLRTGADPDPDRLATLADRFADSVMANVIAAPELPGATMLLETLVPQLPLFVASGTPEDELCTIVTARGWDRFFAGVFGSPADKSTILDGIAARLGHSTQDLVLVGDAATDRDGARAAGARFVLVGPAEAAAGPDEPRVDDPAALLRILEHGAGWRG